MRVLIKSAMTREVASKKTGVVYLIQSAAVETGDDFPKPFDILHDDRKKVYPPGNYTFAPDAIYVDRQGKLAVSPRLVPEGKPAAPAAPKV